MGHNLRVELAASVGKSLCPRCHRFYSAETGLIVPELAHIRVTYVDEKDFCRECLIKAEDG